MTFLKAISIKTYLFCVLRDVEHLHIFLNLVYAF